jgi:hypothetical protein
MTKNIAKSSWVAFSRPFYEMTLDPVDHDAVANLVARINRDAKNSLVSLEFLADLRPAPAPRSERSHAGSAPSAAGHSERGASPTPSSISSHATASKPSKRPRVDTRGDDAGADRRRKPVSPAAAAAIQLAADAAAAVVVQQGELKLTHDDPLSVQAFMPEISACVLAIRQLLLAVNPLLSLIYECGESAPDKMTAAAFLAHSLVVDPQDQGIPEVRLRDHLMAVLDCVCKIQPLAARAGASSTRCYEAYKLMTRTKFADELTLIQLQSREAHDSRSAAMLEVHQPLTKWMDKVTAALIACEQQQAMTKEGHLLGPVDPRVKTHLAKRRAHPPRGAGPPSSGGKHRPASAWSKETSARRPASSPGGKPSAPGGAKAAAAGKKRKRSSAGSGAAAAAAAGT